MQVIREIELTRLQGLTTIDLPKDCKPLAVIRGSLDKVFLVVETREDVEMVAYDICVLTKRSFSAEPIPIPEQTLLLTQYFGSVTTETLFPSGTIYWHIYLDRLLFPSESRRCTCSNCSTEGLP